MSYDSDDDDDSGDSKYTLVFEGDETVYRSISRDGKGTATFGNGDVFVGMYADKKRNGKGVYTFIAGGKYDGEYVENEKDGQGEMTYTDGGIFTGDWKRDKRNGFGTYLYPNGDTYTGMWKNGKKHGQGRYVYVDNGSAIDGRWIANRCVTGEWSMHDKSKYVGRFANNIPAGNGMFVFANKNKQSGVFAENKWKSDSFTKPSPIAPLPKPVKATPFTWASRAIEKSQIVVDHFEGILEIKNSEIPGIPNFRRANNLPVWGGSQPTLTGIKAMMENLGDQEPSKVFWVSLRNTPVCYINDLSFTSAARDALSRPMVFPELEMEDLPKLDQEFANKVIVNVKATGGIMEYWKIANADVEEDVKKEGLVMEVEAKKDEDDDTELEPPLPVLTPDALFAPEGFAEKEELEIVYTRMNIPFDTMPDVKEIEKIITLSKEIEGGSGIYFCCRDGIKRTTTAMIISSLVRKLFEEVEDPDDDDGGDDDDDIPEQPSDDEMDPDEYRAKILAERAEAAAKAAAEAAANKLPDYKAGDFKLILGFVAALGETGEALKAEVDDVINRNAQIINERELIADMKEKYEKTQNPEFLKKGKQYINRYIRYLLIFHYLKSNPEGESEKTYTEWVDEPAQVALLRDHLGTMEIGPLSEFDLTS